MSFSDDLYSFYSPQLMALGPPSLESRECGYLVQFREPGGEIEHRCNLPKFMPCERTSCPANDRKNRQSEGMIMSTEIKRGEIYYIEIPHATGHEMEKTRPGIVVSCDELNRTSQCVAVVMCSASSKRELPEHITIRSTPVVSAAMCEHIYTVDKSRVSRFLGSCTKAEMAALEIGMMSAFGMGGYGLARPETEAEEEPAERETAPQVQPNLELAVVRTERDTYKRMYESLLDRMSMERRAGA